VIRMAMPLFWKGGGGGIVSYSPSSSFCATTSCATAAAHIPPWQPSSSRSARPPPRWLLDPSAIAPFPLFPSSPPPPGAKNLEPPPLLFALAHSPFSPHFPSFLRGKKKEDMR
jgi:hypothetical protein